MNLSKSLFQIKDTTSDFYNVLLGKGGVSGKTQQGSNEFDTMLMKLKS